MQGPVRANKAWIDEAHSEDPKATVQVTTLGRRTDKHLETLSASTKQRDEMNVAKSTGTDFEKIAAVLVYAKKHAADMVARFRSVASLDSEPKRVAKI
jgi:hypothetical protein